MRVGTSYFSVSPRWPRGFRRSINRFHARHQASSRPPAMTGYAGSDGEASRRRRNHRMITWAGADGARRARRHGPLPSRVWSTSSTLPKRNGKPFTAGQTEHQQDQERVMGHPRSVPRWRLPQAREAGEDLAQVRNFVTHGDTQFPLPGIRLPAAFQAPRPTLSSLLLPYDAQSP